MVSERDCGLRRLHADFSMLTVICAGNHACDGGGCRRGFARDPITVYDCILSQRFITHWPVMVFVSAPAGYD